MTFELTILSIFRQSSTYLPRYFSQIATAFKLRGGRCHAIWLEGDSTDTTHHELMLEKTRLESLGHAVTLVKFDLNGPYWASAQKKSDRWFQLATCWNRCMQELLPTKFAVCVESDLIWEVSTIEKIIPNLTDERQVICPMLMIEDPAIIFGFECFYDTWGFSRGGKKFVFYPPYWESDLKLIEDERFLQLTSGGGMLVTTYEKLLMAKWGLDSCVLQYPAHVKIFMDKTLKIYHPAPLEWRRHLENQSALITALRKTKYRALGLRKHCQNFLRSLKVT